MRGEDENFSAWEAQKDIHVDATTMTTERRVPGNFFLTSQHVNQS